MGLWSRIVDGVRRPAPVVADRIAPRFNTAFSESFWPELMGNRTASGESVNYKSALEVTTALRCALVIADGVATVPCKVMRKDPATGRRSEAVDHPLNDVLTIEANGWMDPLQMLETTALHAVFAGAGRAFINRVRGRIVEIIPLEPGRITAEQMPDYRIKYTATAASGETREIPQEAIWEVRGPSWDGWRGLDIVHLAREALGLAMATENAHARRFSNGVQSTGMYTVEGNLNEEQYLRLYGWLTANHIGAKNSGKPFLMDRGAKWAPLDMNGVDAQHLETRRNQVEEICRAFGVMPIMVGHSDKAATYASAEQMFLHHAVGTVRPWHRRFERSMKRQLLTRDEVKAGYYIKFFDTELLRGAAKDRSEYYWKLFQMGAFSPNDILELEDQDGYEAGGIHLVPSNMMTAENAAKAGPPGAGNNGGPPLDDPEEPTEPPDPAARSQRLNAGRVLSAANERKIRTAKDELVDVLAKLDTQPAEE